MIDLSQSFESIKGRVEALKTYKQVSDDEKQLTTSAGNSQSPSTDANASQLGQVENQKKRFQRNPETSLDRLTSLLSTTRGSGNSTLIYLRKKMIEVFQKNHVKVVTLSRLQADQWRAIARESSYKEFASKVPGGQALIEKALSVQ